MPVTHHTLHTPWPLLLLRSVELLLRAAQAGLHHAMAARRRGRRAQDTARALQALDERTLRDLGLDRSDICSPALLFDDTRRVTWAAQR